MEISVEQATRTGNLGQLVEEHRRYSRKLDVMLSQPYLSESEKIEAARLKKLKLKLKDEMERYARPRSNSMSL